MNFPSAGHYIAWSLLGHKKEKRRKNRMNEGAAHNYKTKPIYSGLAASCLWAQFEQTNPNYPVNLVNPVKKMKMQNKANRDTIMKKTKQTQT
jgi:hypothetical protein